VVAGADVVAAGYDNGTIRLLRYVYAVDHARLLCKYLLLFTAVAVTQAVDHRSMLE
jgi:hypothetical protein